jgi:hypothetical protein
MEKINCDRFGIKNLLEQPAVFGEKRTQKLSPGLIKDQDGLFHFFGRSLLSTTITSILIDDTYRGLIITGRMIPTGD